jgi:hypothetical protein
MALGPEQALVAAVSGAALILTVGFASVWAAQPDEVRGVDSVGIVSPAPFNDPPYCHHLIDGSQIAHQILLRVHSLAENPPPPPGGVAVVFSQGSTRLGNATTDGLQCASLTAPGAGSYVFAARAEQTVDGVRHEWWSNSITRYYSGDPPGFIEIRLNNYARYA